MRLSAANIVQGSSDTVTVGSGANAFDSSVADISFRFVAQQQSPPADAYWLLGYTPRVAGAYFLRIFVNGVIVPTLSQVVVTPGPVTRIQTSAPGLLRAAEAGKLNIAPTDAFGNTKEDSGDSVWRCVRRTEWRGARCAHRS